MVLMVIPTGELPLRDRILIHILMVKDGRKTELTGPYQLTTKGIIEALSVSRVTILLALHDLIRDGLVSAESRHPVPDGRRQSIYELTPKGYIEAKELYSRLKAQRLLP